MFRSGLFACLIGGLAIALAVPIAGRGGRPASDQARTPSYVQPQPAAGKATAQPPEGQRGSAPRQRDPRLSWDWWKDDDVRKELGLTDEQVRRIDGIYQRRVHDMQPYYDAWQKKVEEVDRMTRERTADFATYEMQVSQAEGLRSKLLISRYLMLYRIYRELSPEQHKKLQTIIDRRRTGRGGGATR